MNLIPSGDNLKPTNGANGVHEPLTLYFEGQPVRFIIRDGVPFDLAPAWVLSDVAKALGFKKPRDAGSGLSEGVDRGSNLIGSLGGPQQTKVLTYTGLTKLLMRSDKETARRFQDWLAAKSSDLTFYGVAFRNTDAQTGLAQMQSPGITKSDILEIATALIPVISQAISQALQSRTALAADTRRRVDLENLPTWSNEEYAAQKTARQLVYVPEWLMQETGKKPTNASALTRRIISFCREMEEGALLGPGSPSKRRSLAAGWQVYPYQHHGSIRYLVPRDAARLVYRSGWTKRNPVDVLAPQLADVIDLDARRSS